MPNRHSKRSSEQKKQSPTSTNTHALRFRGDKEVTTAKTEVAPTQDE